MSRDGWWVNIWIFPTQEYERIYRIIRSKYKFWRAGSLHQFYVSHEENAGKCILSQKIINNSVWYTSSNISRDLAACRPYMDMCEWVVAFCLVDRYVHIDHSGCIDSFIREHIPVELHIRSLLPFQYLICFPRCILKCLFSPYEGTNITWLSGLPDLIILCHCASFLRKVAENDLNWMI